VQTQITALRIPVPVGTHIRRRIEAELQHPTVPGQFAPQRRKGVVGVDYRNPVRGEPCKQLALGAGNALEIAEALEVRRSGIGHHGDGGLCNSGKVVDFSGVVSAHFQNGEFILGTQSRQRQRQADIVVQVAVRGQCPA